ncbi:5-amino-6-(D-ribitylamino)uracil--L-tyrosine 4-hydroxyphenyl transferase CofH [Hydrogenophaga sp.]|uniref:5-amino-6-(D-ribitylamino)uracil--L-tyrosine 4-hydroxyphenyl transferase CofH n=1 Tax=Hydrogenophaga sp. TaxID=1904254 RepID=UPI00271BD6B6|nr:5-amino-6-(D-ribitylamino)uracil--L-tyrosine 4-hydroxyphenyl transferase CofH [Hydrogenophaga sp.]MDO9435936.1 5-amino-6-(D-ribitylamino)uracil--L-tyrosine 4-hydroxyphenyl transferase CofH [Hydrogenophaga sp.]
MNHLQLLSASFPALQDAAKALARRTFGHTVTWSPKVFVPLTMLCRDYCGYCTFSRHTDKKNPYLELDEVLAITAAGVKAGCHEALFTLGDKPELRHPAAREWLSAHGHESTVDYLVKACAAVQADGGMLAHVNAGILTRNEMARLREVSVSLGLMLESTSDRLMQKGGPHFRSPDKAPGVRIRMLEEAGELRIPVTTGLLIGIGETREERLDALLAIERLHQQHGHIQEVIIQNFCPKPGTPMQSFPAAGLEDQLWTITVARQVLSPQISIQAPPNLRPDGVLDLIASGANDLGGISPVTPDHVNPEAAWPQVDQLKNVLAQQGYALTPRLPVYPRYIAQRKEWIDPGLHSRVLRASDSEGLARDDGWRTGQAMAIPVLAALPRASRELAQIVAKAESGARLSADDVCRMYGARGAEVTFLVESADRMRAHQAGETIRYVVNRNINYTNICSFRCGFCAFSKRTTTAAKGDAPYLLSPEEVAERAREAWARGATEVCMQGGIHPSYDGNTYLGILRAVKAAEPAIHVHAFSPLEVSHGASTLKISVREFLQELCRAGLGSLPGTAAEILHDDVRDIICPDKLRTAEWLDVVRTSHEVGIRTTSTMMFGHVDAPVHWAAHLLALRDLQVETGGITEFVPLPFVPDQSPMYRKGQARSGPTWRETLLTYAISRLVLGAVIPNIQTSWVKIGRAGAMASMRAGANDFGGVLMNESISRAAGAQFGQEMDITAFHAMGLELGRPVAQRTTLYDRVPTTPVQRSAVSRPLLQPLAELSR